MTYDENEDYNGPDTHRRGPFLFMAAIVGVVVVAGFGAAVSDAKADPNAQTVLPADGVLSIERTGDVWSVTTDGIPSEVKIMSPVNQPICGVNYPTPCTTVTTFTVAADCTYWQIDGLPGHSSSDPYICLGGTPSSTPAATEPASPSPTPTATTEPSPSPEPTSSPTLTPEPSSSPNPSPEIGLSVQSPTSASTGGTPPTDSAMATEAAAPARLADTGTNLAPYIAVPFLLILTGLLARIGAVQETSRWSVTPYKEKK